jgi:hypothetical protein
MSEDKPLSDVTVPAHRAIATLSTGGIPAIVPQTMDEVWRFSQVLAKSGLLPKGIETPEQVTVQILTGFELGLKPMVAVQNIAVINGRPSIGGDLALAVLMTSGLLEDHDEWIDGEGDARVAICKVQRKGMKPIERRFSVKDAIQAGLWETQAMVRKTYWDKEARQRKQSNFETPNESPWYRYQERMLKMRARGFAFRDRFPDVLKGMHLAEEMMGHEEVEPTREAPSSPSARTAIEAPPAPPPDEEKPAPQQPPHERARDEQWHDNGRDHPTPPPVEDAEFTETKPSPAYSQGNFNSDQEEDEPFDPEAWLDEARDLFATCKTVLDVDQAHETFEGTVEGDLSLTERQRYQDIHEAALARVKPIAHKPRFFIDPDRKAYLQTDDSTAPAGMVEVREPEYLEFKAQSDAHTDDDGPGAPPTDGPPTSSHEEYRAWILAEMQAPGIDYARLTELWAGTKEIRRELVESGKMTVEDRKAIQKQMETIWNGLSVAKERKPDPKPEEPTPPPVEGAGDDVAAQAKAFTERLAAELEAAETVPVVNDIGTATFPERTDLLKAGADPVLDGLWRSMVVKRRNTLNGI